MTSWNLSYDCAALCFFLLIFVWYFNEKKIPLRSNRVFLALITTSFLATALEVAATEMARSMEIVGFDFFYAVLTLQTLAINLVPIVFTAYILLLADIDPCSIRRLELFFSGSVLIDVVLSMLNLKFRWLFLFEQEKYQTLPVLLVMYGIDVVMILVSVVTMIRYRRNFQFLRLLPLTFNLLCGVTASILQAVFYIPLLNFMLSAICMTLYYYQQNSSMVTDAVTNLFDRNFMGEYVRNQYMERKKFGILLIALDDFKFINKTYGVETGDGLLCQVARYLERLNFAHTVFRFGSDQFCIVLEQGIKQIDEVAEQIHQRFYHSWTTEMKTAIMMSATICCMECPAEASNYGELIEIIDYSMSIAKKTRKGLITRAHDLDLEQIRRDKAVEKALKLAIDRNELMVYYQPIFSNKQGVYNSAEALVRLHDETLGWISPEIFIPIAEKNGLIIEMGEIILEKVCRFIHDNNLSQTTIEYVEVNISPVQLMQIDFADRVSQIMEKYGVRPGQINIEITETATMNSAATVTRNMNQLIEYGISFSLDDYGSGNANIDYINHMPFRIIKIDKTLVWDSFKNSKAQITLEYTIRMLNALHLYIVAEGVENQEMDSRLAEYGCHYIQGWYYSKAVPEQEFMALIRAQNAKGQVI